MPVNQITPTICGHNAIGQAVPTASNEPVPCRQCGADLYHSAGSPGALVATFPGNRAAAHVAATKLL